MSRKATLQETTTFKKNIKAWLEFAKTYSNWTVSTFLQSLFSDESKYDIYGNDDIQYVHWPQGKRLDPKYVVPTVKHGGGNIMVWGCFSYYSMGPIHKISGTMDRFKYLDALCRVGNALKIYIPTWQILWRTGLQRKK